MLERVSAALSKFLAPLTSSINNGLNSDLSNKETIQRFKRKAKQEDPKAKGKPSVLPKNKPNLKLVQPFSETETKIVAGFNGSITDIFALFQEQRKVMQRWGGAKTYETLVRAKGMSQLRKGTIFDEEAE
jgi:hypothetical protein